MMLQKVFDILLCIAFLAILQKTTQAWYSSLKLRSIHSFE